MTHFNLSFEGITCVLCGRLYVSVQIRYLSVAVYLLNMNKLHISTKDLTTRNKDMTSQNHTNAIQMLCYI